MNPSPQEIFNHLKKHYPITEYHSVYEAGFCGFWIHRALCELGINNIVVNPTDVPTKRQESLRLLSRLLVQVTKRTTQTNNRIKQFFCTQVIQLPTKAEISHWSKRFINWLNAIEFEYDHSKYYLDKLLSDLERERIEKLNLLRQMRKIIKGNKIISYLRTVPGVGTITAFTFHAEINKKC